MALPRAPRPVPELPVPCCSEPAACRGDAEGALAVRRKLLSPALRGFGAARQRDVCVLWAGGAARAEQQQEAVCYPPCGWVPRCFVGEQTGWTIMPDAFRREEKAKVERIYER